MSWTFYAFVVVFVGIPRKQNKKKEPFFVKILQKKEIVDCPYINTTEKWATSLRLQRPLLCAISIFDEHLVTLFLFDLTILFNVAEMPLTNCWKLFWIWVSNQNISFKVSFSIFYLRWIFKILMFPFIHYRVFRNSLAKL